MSSEKIIKQVEEKAKEKKEKKIIELLSTGCTILDLILGGGMAVGHTMNIVGDESTGKTLISIEFCVFLSRLLKDKIKVVYDDAESGFGFDTKAIYGIKIFDEDYDFSGTVEDFRYNLKYELSRKKENQYLIYVLDSLDAISSDDELEYEAKRDRAKKAGKKLDKGTYGTQKAKEMSKFFRVMNKEIKEKRCILIIVSQTRMKINVMFGSKVDRTGGKALNFYSTQIIYLSECEKIEKKERAVSVTIKVKAKKNKVGKPFRQGFINILFDFGIDNISTNIDYLYELKDKTGKLKRGEKKLEWGDQEYTRDGLIKFIEEKNLETELERRVIEEWNRIEDEISSKNRKRKY